MSRYADTSASAVARRAAQKAVASYYITNPPTTTAKSMDVSTLIQLIQGRQTILQGPTGAIVNEGCCCGPSINYTARSTTPNDPTPYSSPPLGKTARAYELEWSNLPGTVIITADASNIATGGDGSKIYLFVPTGENKSTLYVLYTGNPTETTVQLTTEHCTGTIIVSPSLIL